MRATTRMWLIVACLAASGAVGGLAGEVVGWEPAAMAAAPASSAAGVARAAPSGRSLGTPSTVASLRVEQDAEHTRVVVHGSGVLTFSASRLSDPPRIVVDVSNAHLGPNAPGTVEVYNGAVLRVDTVEFEAGGVPTVRVVVGLRRDLLYEVDTHGDDLVLTVQGGRAPAIGDSGASVSAPADPSVQQRLRAELEAARKREAALRDRVARARQREAALRAQIESARERARQEQAQVDARHRAVEEAEAQRRAAARAAEEARAELAKLRASEGEHAARMEQLEKELARRQQALRELDDELAKRRTALRQAQDKASAALAVAQAEVARLEKQAREFKERRDALQAEVAVQEARERALQEQVEAARNELAVVEDKRSTEEQRLAALREQARALREELKRLEQRRSELARQAKVQAKARQEAAQTQIAGIEARLKRERARGRHADRALIRKLRAELERVRREAAAREAKERAEAKRALAALESQRDTAKKALGEATARIEQLQARVAELEAKARAGQRAEAELAALRERRQREAAAMQARIDHLQAEIARVRAEASAERGAARKAAAEARLAALQAKLDAARREAEDAEAAARARIAALEAERDAARRKAAALERRVDSLQSALRQEREGSKQAQAAPRPAPVRIEDVRFDSDSRHDVVAVDAQGSVRWRLVRQGARQSVLLLENASLPERLERSLDTRDFGGPVVMLSSFRSRDPSEAGAVRIVVNTTRGVPSRVVRTSRGIRWEFDRVGARPVAQADRRTTRRVRFYPDVASPAAGPTAVGALDQYSGGVGRHKRYTGKHINLTIKDADIRHVLTFLAKEGGINIIASDDVKGTVTFHLEDVPWDLALDMILKVKGLDYVREQGVYRVAPAEKIRKEIEEMVEKKKKLQELRQLVVRLIPVNYAAASSLMPQAKSLLSGKGSVEMDERTNTLIVKDYADHVKAVERLVRELDLQTPQVLIEARIVEASTAFTRDFGIQWGGSFAASPVFGNETGLAFPSVIGVSGGATGNGSNVDGLFTGVPGYAVNLPAPAGPGAGGAIGLTLGNLSGSANLALRLSAQEEEGKVKIISSPRISTLDNKTARISQGVSIPISVVSAQGVNTQFFNADLSLEVTPHVTRDGHISLKIVISKNEPDFGRTAANGNPTIQRKEASTELLLDDGETTVIGGIYTRNYGTSYHKVPFFADIPVLGWLFKNKSEKDQRSELLIFITPRIVNREALEEPAAAEATGVPQGGTQQ